MMACLARSGWGLFLAVMTLFTLASAAVVGGLYWLILDRTPAAATDLSNILVGLFALFLLLSAIVSWIIVRAHRSRYAAMKEAENHVQKLIEEILAHGVTGRELERARDAAEAANAAKSRYLVSVSHEIRSPLNSIYGYAQLMERGHDVPPAEAAKVIRRSAEHLTNLVEGLLDISQVESGVLRISNDTVRLGAFLDQIANMFRPQAQAKGIDFIYDRPPALPELVRTDQKRLRQILINLLSNAIKFTHAGGVTFRVSYRSQLATFEITDTGIGISPDDIERVFDPFDRGTHPDAQRQKGVGIGLSITNALVHILGGDLQVSSEVGKGTRFTARLMLGHIAAPTAEKAPESIKGYGGERRSVLLIDDDSSQLAILRSLLEPLGFRVREALSGAAGIAIAAREPPDLVLLDISMPGESGWDVARSLRDAHGSTIRIVMISANAHEFRRGSDGISSHDMFLMKPVSLDALLDVIADQLQLHWDGTEDERATHAAMAQPYAFAILPETAAPYLAEIEQKALIGHVRGMESKIRELQSVVPEAEPLAAHLLACLDRFDLKGLTAAIKASR